MSTDRMTEDSRPKDPVTLVFDIGGVLIESNGYVAFQKLLNIRMTDQAVRDMWLSSPSVEAFETGRIGAAEFGQMAVAEFGINLSAEDFLAAFTNWPGDFYPGALPTLSELSQRYRLACLSNSNVLHWRDIFDDLFEVSISSHRSGFAKPGRGAFAHLAEQLQCAPDQIVFFDDSLMNVKAAKDFGIRAFHTFGFDQTRQTLIEQGFLER